MQEQVTGSVPLPRSDDAVNRAASQRKGLLGRLANPFELVPQAGLQQLGSNLFRAEGPEAWLGINLECDVPAGRWIRLSYRAGLSGDPVRPLLRMMYADGRHEIDIMAGPVCGEAHWVCRVPPGVVALEVNPVAQPGTFAFSLDRLVVLSRARLMLGALRRKPGLAVSSLLLRLRGKRVRARHFIKSIWASTPFDRYRAWLAERQADPLPEPAPALEREVVILIDGRGATAAQLERTQASIEAQRVRPKWLLLDTAGLAGGKSVAAVLADTLAEAAEAGAWLGVVGAGDLLAPDAVAVMMAAAARNPGWTAIYSDEDSIDRAGGGHAPRLKPDWSPRLQQGRPYVGGLLLVHAERLGELAIGADGSSSLEDALLTSALAGIEPEIGHVRRILYHRSTEPGPRAAIPPRRAEPASLERPSASVIIPTRDRLGLLKPCVEGLRFGTEYPDFEVILVDNGSTEAETRAYYAALCEDRRLRILDCPGPFNFSALANAGVAAARGQVIVLLNNDIEMIAPDWLERMVAEAARPEVGAVGAKLLYPDGRLQHGGVVIGLGGAAGHVHRGRSGAADGWFGRLAVTHEVSAVTGACLAVARDKYNAVAGLDENLFPISFNDIDFCLKLRAHGWQNLMVPGAVLYHHESASRGHDKAGAKQARAEREAAAFAEKWLPVMRDDPFFHPGLSLLRFDVSLG